MRIKTHCPHKIKNAPVKRHMRDHAMKLSTMNSTLLSAFKRISTLQMLSILPVTTPGDPVVIVPAVEEAPAW